MKEIVRRDFYFANDCARNVGSEPEIMPVWTNFLQLVKFWTHHQYSNQQGNAPPCSSCAHTESKITIKSQKAKAVNHFNYFVRNIYQIATKASSAFCRLHSIVCECQRMSETAKLKVYRTVVLTTLLYACEMWTVY